MDTNSGEKTTQHTDSPRQVSIMPVGCLAGDVLLGSVSGFLPVPSTKKEKPK